MEERTTRALGALGVAGGLLALVASVPSRWYGLTETDAYVFDPAILSPLWIERTLVPLVGLLAVAMLFAALAGLVLRDRSVAGRLRRWSGYVGLVGLVFLLLTQVLVTAGGPDAAAGQIAGALFAIAGALAGLVAVVLLLPALLALGIGYARTDRPWVGYALAGGTGLGLALTAALSNTTTGLESLPSVAPILLGFVAVGAELWTHPEPVPEAGSGAEAPADSRDDGTAETDGPADGERAETDAPPVVERERDAESDRGDDGSDPG